MNIDQSARLGRQWATFRERVVHPDATPTQVVEMRRAWYAGAEALFLLMSDFDPSPDPTDSDMVIMDGIYEELQSFAKDVAEGRA